MTIYLQKINGYYISEVATFGAAAPVAGDTWIYVPHQGMEPLGHAPQFHQSVEANSMGASVKPYFTVSGGKFTIKVLAHTGTLGLDGAGGDTAPTSFPFQKLFENYMGAAVSAGFAGSTVSSGGPNSVVLTSATGVVVGAAHMFASGAIRVVKSMTGTTMTYDRALTTSTDYDAGAPVYGAAFYKATTGQYAKYLYITHVMNNRVNMLGPCRVTDFKMTTSAKNELMFEFELTGSHYYPGTGVTPSSIPAQTFTGLPLVASGGEFAVGGTARAVKTISVQGPISHVEQQSATTSGAADGVSGWVAESVDKGSIEEENVIITTDVDNWLSVTAAEVSCSFTTGSTGAAKARGGFNIYAPNCTIEAPDSAMDGQRSTKNKLTPRIPVLADITAGLMPMGINYFGGV